MEMNPPHEAALVLAKDWFRRCRESQMAHFEYGSILEKRHILFGIPAIVLSTAVGTAVFASWETGSTQQWHRILFGLLSIAAACMAALQTFLNLSDRAAKHKASGAAYGAVRRELELFKMLPPTTDEQLRQELEKIKNRMDELAASAPSIPSRHKEYIDKIIKSRLSGEIFDFSDRAKGE